VNPPDAVVFKGLGDVQGAVAVHHGVFKIAGWYFHALSVVNGNGGYYLYHAKGTVKSKPAFKIQSNPAIQKHLPLHGPKNAKWYTDSTPIGDDAYDLL
jgi:hypothetical protein